MLDKTETADLLREQEELTARAVEIESVIPQEEQRSRLGLTPTTGLELLKGNLKGIRRRLDRISIQLAATDQLAKLEADELKRTTEIEALQHYIEYYALTLELEQARLLWCAARSAVPGGLAEMPLMSSEYIAEWAADRLVELGAVEDLPAVEVADLAALP